MHEGLASQLGLVVGLTTTVAVTWMLYRRRVPVGNRTSGWFTELYGFEETNYHRVKLNFLYQPATPENNFQGTITSKANNRIFSVGKFSTPSLGELRARVLSRDGPGDGQVRLRRHHTAVRDIYEFHQREDMTGAVFQVASQFNCLEFPSPHHIPEHGITNYASDLTQGPACSLACPSATLFRNYFVETPQGNEGQTREDQLNNLQGLEHLVDNQSRHYWTTRNGYTDSTSSRLSQFNELLRQGEWNVDQLRDSIRMGLHEDIPVIGTYENGQPLRHHVTQTFCSALSIGYSQANASDWEPLARLVLDAMYENTMWAAVDNLQQGRGSTVVLTFLGGGVFGNNWKWIVESMSRAMAMVAHKELDVHIVYHRRVEETTRELIENEFERQRQLISQKH